MLGRTSQDPNSHTAGGPAGERCWEVGNRAARGSFAAGEPAGQRGGAGNAECEVWNAKTASFPAGLPSSVPKTPILLAGWPSSVPKTLALLAGCPSSVPKTPSLSAGWPSSVPKTPALPAGWPSSDPKEGGHFALPSLSEIQPMT